MKIILFVINFISLFFSSTAWENLNKFTLFSKETEIFSESRQFTRSAFDDLTQKYGYYHFEETFNDFKVNFLIFYFL